MWAKNRGNGIKAIKRVLKSPVPFEFTCHHDQTGWSSHSFRVSSYLDSVAVSKSAFSAGSLNPPDYSEISLFFILFPSASYIHIQTNISPSRFRFFPSHLRATANWLATCAKREHKTRPLGNISHVYGKEVQRKEQTKAPFILSNAPERQWSRIPVDRQTHISDVPRSSSFRACESSRSGNKMCPSPRPGKTNLTGHKSSLIANYKSAVPGSSRRFSASTFETHNGFFTRL